jgi:hypothetical protein
VSFQQKETQRQKRSPEDYLIMLLLPLSTFLLGGLYLRFEKLENDNEILKKDNAVHHHRIERIEKDRERDREAIETIGNYIFRGNNGTTKRQYSSPSDR